MGPCRLRALGDAESPILELLALFALVSRPVDVYFPSLELSYILRFPCRIHLPPLIQILGLFLRVSVQVSPSYSWHLPFFALLFILRSEMLGYSAELGMFCWFFLSSDVCTINIIIFVAISVVALLVIAPGCRAALG